MSVSDDRVHVCFVLPSLNGGGAERAAVKVLNALDPSRFRRSLYLFRREGRYLADVAAAVEVVAARRDDRWSRIRELSRYFGASRPDVVVSFLSYFSTFAAAALLRRSPRVIVNLQTPMSAFLRDGDYQWRAPLKRRVFQQAVRMMYPRASAVVATSRGVAADLTETFRVPAARIVVIPNPIDLAEIDALSQQPVDEVGGDGPPLIVAAGRLAEAKNYPLLIESLRLLRQTHQFRALILGEGELLGSIRRAIADARLDGDVRLCGFQSNPWKFMARADVFALTSHYEGFGNVVVEAMACRCPIVATASPGTTEIIERGRTGLIVDRHEPGAFAGALAELLTEPARRQSMAEAARQAAERYALGPVVERYASLFKRVAA